MIALGKSAFRVIAIFFLVMAAQSGKAQEQSSVHPTVCEPQANVAGTEPKQCCCAAPSQIGCCYDAPQGPRKECFADEFQLVLPLPHRATQAILSANGALVLGPRSSVRARASVDQNIVFGEISNLGEASTIVGAGASVGSLFSNARVTLGEGVTVNGPLTAGGRLSFPRAPSLKAGSRRTRTSLGSSRRWRR